MGEVEAPLQERPCGEEKGQSRRDGAKGGDRAGWSGSVERKRESSE